MFTDHIPADRMRELVVHDEIVLTGAPRNVLERAYESIGMEDIVDRSHTASEESQTEEDRRGVNIPGKGVFFARRVFEWVFEIQLDGFEFKRVLSRFHGGRKNL